LCRAVAKEGGPHGVRANVICPGFVMTDMVTQQFATLAQDLGIAEDEVVARVLEATTVDGELTLPSDVADVAVFLAAFPTTTLTGYTDETIDDSWRAAQQFATEMATGNTDPVPRIAGFGVKFPFTATAFGTALEMLNRSDFLQLAQDAAVPLVGLLNAKDEA